MLEISNLSLHYGQHLALDQVSIRLDEGETIAILGSNGAGKSSLLKAISGIETANEGSVIRLSGQDLTAIPAHKRTHLGLSLVPEGRGLFPDLTVQENLLLGANVRAGRKKEKENRSFVFDLFPKLAARATQMVGTMSGGEQQMVAIGRALMASPRLLMLDEPSLGLAPIVVGELFDALQAVRGAGVSMLIVEQNVKSSLALSDRGYLMETGRITREAAAADLAADPDLQKAYLGASS